ncbi:MAG TPA: helix-turn-helix domain-containing protein, partial [Gemmatimonadota bacterium]|nr:helix-turn-helix domain-containing protein [Gemmatimonadota bacterium]
MYNPTPTAEALLRAAHHLFARFGYDGTSVRAITREAGSNLGAVTYHFGSKEALYDSVLVAANDAVDE